jgi:hypothetical protein
MCVGGYSFSLHFILSLGNAAVAHDGGGVLRWGREVINEFKQPSVMLPDSERNAVGSPLGVLPQFIYHMCSLNPPLPYPLSTSFPLCYCDLP